MVRPANGSKSENAASQVRNHCTAAAAAARPWANEILSACLRDRPDKSDPCCDESASSASHRGLVNDVGTDTFWAQQLGIHFRWIFDIFKTD